MATFSRAVTAYVVVLVVAAVTLLVVMLNIGDDPDLEHVGLSISFAGVMTLTHLYPLQFLYRSKLTLDTTIIFAAVLVFEPGDAMLIVAAGTFIAHQIRREMWIEAAFNSAQTMLQAGAGGALLLVTGWSYSAAAIDSVSWVLMIVVVATIIYLVNTTAVATIIGLQSGLSPLHVWRQMIRFDAVEQLAQLALGLLAAVMTDTHVWTLPLLLVPAYAVYRSLKRTIGLHQQTLDAVESLADIVDLRDQYTADHSQRVADYARELATAYGLTYDEVEIIVLAARVHDIGKVVVDRHLLAVANPITDVAREQLRRHPETGAQILSRFPQFVLASSFVRHHHERLDGSGYPDGLHGEQIPMGARIIAVADAFDAMATARPYRPALAAEELLAELVRNRGSHWDERVVDVLLELLQSGRIALPGMRVVSPDSNQYPELAIGHAPA